MNSVKNEVNEVTFTEDAQCFECLKVDFPEY